MIKKTVILIFDICFVVAVIAAAFYFIKPAWANFYKSQFPIKFEEIVARESERTGVPQALIYAVINTESSFNPSAQSSVPARGLMQLTEDTFDWVKSGVRDSADATYNDMFDPELNIIYGTELLRKLLLEFGSETNALCAYHAGWGSAKKWLSSPEHSDNDEIINIPFGDTKRYVAKVLKTKDIYNTLYFERT